MEGGRWTRRNYRARGADANGAVGDGGLESELWAWALANPQTYDIGRAFVMGASLGFAREKGLLDGLLGDRVPTVAAHRTVVHAAPAPAPDTFWGQAMAWVDPSDPLYPVMLKYGIIGAGASVMKQWALPRQSQGSQREGTARKTRRA
jgi:hypothetical protein